jgi:magnesium chelatase subunit D
MNPEEGELRPQLLDRFGLTVEVAASREPGERVEVVRRRLSYDDDPAGFAARWAGQEQELCERIATARALLPSVELGDGALRRIAAVCAAFEVDGMRADIVMARTAVALAAWAGRTRVESADVRQAALLALPHRRRRAPFDAPGLDEDKLDQTLEENGGQDDDGGPDGGGGPGDGPDGGGGPPQDDAQGPDIDEAAQDTQDAAESDAQPEPSLPGQAGPERSRQATGPQPAGGAADGKAGEPADGSTDEANPESAQGPASGTPVPSQQPAAPTGDPFKARTLTVPGIGEGAAGRRSRARTAHGRTTGARRPRGALGKLHLAATVQAAAPHQHTRGRRGSGLIVRRDDLREATREGREGNLVLFVVDASGSMAARQRMSAVKGAVLSLLLDAYQRRDKVGMVTFRRGEAEVALPPTSSVDAAAARLESLPTGGRTPLAAGLLRAREVLRIERLRDPARRPLLVTVTDGRATGGPDPVVRARQAARLLAFEGTASVVVDCESGHVRLGLARELAAELGGTSITLDELRADAVTELVKQTTSSQNARNARNARSPQNVPKAPHERTAQHTPYAQRTGRAA